MKLTTELLTKFIKELQSEPVRKLIAKMVGNKDDFKGIGSKGFDSLTNRQAGAQPDKNERLLH